MLHINTVHVQRETWVKQLAGEQYKMICSAGACKHTYIAMGLCLLWDYVHIAVLGKVTSA